MSPPPDVSADVLFLKAKETFLDSLSDQERAQFSACASAEDLLASLQANQFVKDHGRWTSFLRKIREFSDHIKPYFEVCNIFLSSNPEFAALAWGGFRLILQLAGNFVSFFEKLMDVLARIGIVMPHYAEILTIGKEHVSDRFRTSLRSFYVDLFEFFKAVSLVFSQKGGSKSTKESRTVHELMLELEIKRTPIVIGQLLWQPFDTKFEIFLKRLEFHGQVLTQEINTIQLKSIASSSEAQDQERRLAQEFRVQNEKYFKVVEDLKKKISSDQIGKIYRNLQHWIRAPQYKEELETSQSLRETGTGNWIFEETPFKAWRADMAMTLNEDDPYANFLWVKGNPGTGKTILASSVIQELQESTPCPGNSRSLVLYFFFSYNDPQKHTKEDAYRSVLSQILLQHCQDGSVLDLFSFIKGKLKSGELDERQELLTDKASPKELLLLLEGIAKRLSDTYLTWYLISDGIDECNKPDEFVTELRTALLGSGGKVILFSRPNVHLLRRAAILKGHGNLSSISVDRSQVESDLRKFFTKHVGLLQGNGMLPEDLLVDDLVTCLLSGSDGMFIWARLMATYLNSFALTPASRLAAIRSLTRPEPLDEMYLRILALISNRIKEERQLARQIFAWLTYGQRILTPAELQDIVTPVNTSNLPNNPRNANDKFTDFEHTVVMVCSSLVEKSPSCRFYRFIHQTALEFFKELCEVRELSLNIDQNIRKHFIAGRGDIQAGLTINCLSYLAFRAPAGPLSGDIHRKARPEEIHLAFPFLAYASENWSYHLHETLDHEQEPSLGTLAVSQGTLKMLLQAISSFLAKPLVLMAWVESFYTFVPFQVHEPPHTYSRSHISHEYLKRWATSITSELDLNGTGNSLVDIATKFSLFVHDLFILKGQWAATLHNNPNEIWGDVTQLTKPQSEFFLKTAALSVKSTAAVNIDDTSLSTQALASVSQPSAEGDVLLVLSIWPTNSFQDLWKKFTSGVVLLDSFTESIFNGWVARIEIWTLDTEDPERMQEYRFPLDHHEVGNHVHKYLANLPRIGQTSQLALPFPTTISSDVEVVIVLKTVFFLGRQIQTRKHMKETQTTPFRSFTVPVQHSDPGQASMRDNSRNKSSRLLKSSFDVNHLRVSYSYKMEISENKRYVLYKESKEVNVLQNSKPVLTCIIVYQLDIAESPGKCQTLGMFGGNGMDLCLSGYWFHPSLPLILLHSRSFINGASVTLWCFKPNESGNGSMRSGFSHQEDTGVTGGTISSFSLTSSVERINFSACGTQIIIKTVGSPHPEIHSIETDPVYQLAQEQAKRQSDRHSKNILGKRRRSTGGDDGELALQFQPQSSNQITGHMSTTHKVAVSSIVRKGFGNVHRQVQVTNQTGGVQHVLSLPNWNGIDNTTVNVRAPIDRDERIRIILNKASKPWYSLSEPEDVNLPVIVRKDVRALAPSSQQPFTERPVERVGRERAIQYKNPSIEPVRIEELVEQQPRSQFSSNEQSTIEQSTIDIVPLEVEEMFDFGLYEKSDRKHSNT